MTLLTQLSLAALGGAALGVLLGGILAYRLHALRDRQQVENVKRIQRAMAKPTV